MFNHRVSHTNITPSRTRYQSFSDDDGATFHSFAPIPSIPDPGCKGGTCAWPAEKALLVTNVDSTSKRVNVTLRASFDDGATWPHSMLISGPGGYSDVVLHTAEGAGAAGVGGGGVGGSKGKDYAAVVFEYDTCEIKLAVVDLVAWLDQ
jgi:hypothetical protein